MARAGWSASQPEKPQDKNGRAFFPNFIGGHHQIQIGACSILGEDLVQKKEFDYLSFFLVVDHKLTSAKLSHSATNPSNFPSLSRVPSGIALGDLSQRSYLLIMTGIPGAYLLDLSFEEPPTDRPFD